MKNPRRMLNITTIVNFIENVDFNKIILKYTLKNNKMKGSIKCLNFRL